MPAFSDFTFPSSTGVNTIHVRQCSPDGQARGIVQIAHGIAEYINRYDPFMAFLAEHGFIAVGEDHLGHGQSIAKSEEQGFFAERDGWHRVLQDLDHLHDIMHKQYPELPYIFFGHSMGSFLTRHYAILHPEKPCLVILCGTGHQTPAMVNGGYWMAEAGVKLYGPRKIANKLNEIAFGGYTKGYEKARTPSDWLNRDPNEVDKYIADPLCGFVPTVSLMRDMMSGIRFITDQKNVNGMNKDTPVLLISGGDDPVGENGKGVERAYKSICRAGVRDVKMKLYPGARHELLNELNRDEVMNDILTWIDEKLEK